MNRVVAALRQESRLRRDLSKQSDRSSVAKLAGLMMSNSFARIARGIQPDRNRPGYKKEPRIYRKNRRIR